MPVRVPQVPRANVQDPQVSSVPPVTTETPATETRPQGRVTVSDLGSKVTAEVEAVGSDRSGVAILLMFLTCKGEHKDWGFEMFRFLNEKFPLGVNCTGQKGLMLAWGHCPAVVLSGTHPSSFPTCSVSVPDRPLDKHP